MRRRQLIAIVLVALAAPLVYGADATALFAPAQLREAEMALERAEAAAALGEYESALRFATQAGLDARLAWSMTDSALLRRDAARVHEQSLALRAQLPRAAAQLTR